MLLTALLFVLIGLELLVIKLDASYWLISALAVGLVLTARFLAVWVPYKLAKFWLTLDEKAPV